MELVCGQVLNREAFDVRINACRMQSMRMNNNMIYTPTKGNSEKPCTGTTGFGEIESGSLLLSNEVVLVVLVTRSLSVFDRRPSAPRIM